MILRNHWTFFYGSWQQSGSTYKHLGAGRRRKSLRLLIEEKDKQIAVVENQVADLEQYNRINDVIIPRLRVKLCSYANRWWLHPISPVNHQPQCVTPWKNSWLLSFGPRGQRWTVILWKQATLFQEEEKMITCHYHKIFKAKTQFKQGRFLRGSDVFIIEHLTKKNADISRKARFLRKLKKTHSMWTTN